VQYKGPEILKHVRDNLEKRVASKQVSFQETSHFIELLDKMLTSYTYLGE
jgi:arginine decarboxylase